MRKFIPIFLLVCAGCPKPPAPPEPLPSNFIERVDALHNVERTKRNLPPLERLESLDAIAQRHADDMARKRKMSHDGFIRRCEEIRILIDGSACSENVAWNQQTPEQLMKSWMDSKGHRNNILGPYRYIGVGGANKYYCVIFSD